MFELIREVEISQIEKYVKLLLEEFLAHQLQGSEYFIMNDFENSQGNHFLIIIRMMKWIIYQLLVSDAGPLIFCF